MGTEKVYEEVDSQAETLLATLKKLNEEIAAHHIAAKNKHETSESLVKIIEESTAAVIELRKISKSLSSVTEKDNHGIDSLNEKIETLISEVNLIKKEIQKISKDNEVRSTSLAEYIDSKQKSRFDKINEHLESLDKKITKSNKGLLREILGTE